MSELNAEDVLSLPEPENRTVSKTFQWPDPKTGKLNSIEVTISANGSVDPDESYRLSRIINDKRETPPRNAMLPGKKPLRIKDATYIRMLEFLQAVCVTPAWSGGDGWHRWAYFGRIVGAEVMDDLIGWALTENWLHKNPLAKEERDEAGEATEQEP